LPIYEKNNLGETYLNFILNPGIVYWREPRKNIFSHLIGLATVRCSI
jgi:hypothetical protein